MISVVMSVYNGERYLMQSVSSILSQSYGDFEFLIVDDCSNDSSWDLLTCIDDERIKLFRNPENLGLTKNLNMLISKSSGKYIARMDADDIAMPERFQKQVGFLEENPAVDICGTWFRLFTENGESRIVRHPVKDECIRVAMLAFNPIGHPTVLMRREVFESYSYSEYFRQAQDYKLWADLAKAHRFENLPEVLLDYRTHSVSVSSLDQTEQNKNATNIRISLFKRYFLHLSERDLAFVESVFGRQFGRKGGELVRFWLIFFKCLFCCFFANNRLHKKYLFYTFKYILKNYIG